MMKERIEGLKKLLDEAAALDVRLLADEIKAIGFKCHRCAQCCREEYGDNTVLVFPSEIKRICEKTGLGREDIAVPAPSGDRDPAGKIHTFEWVLRKKGECIFLDKNLCLIYECRPYICGTYPFYLREGRLMVSECIGLGEIMGHDECMGMASLLKERYITEIKEAILLFEKFRGFKNRGTGTCVHDSEGEHWVQPEKFSPLFQHFL